MKKKQKSITDGPAAALGAARRGAKLVIEPCGAYNETPKLCDSDVNVTEINRWVTPRSGPMGPNLRGRAARYNISRRRDMLNAASTWTSRLRSQSAPPSGTFLIRASAGGVRGLGLGRPSDASWFPAFIACLLAS